MPRVRTHVRARCPSGGRPPRPTRPVAHRSTTLCPAFEVLTRPRCLLLACTSAAVYERQSSPLPKVPHSSIGSVGHLFHGRDHPGCSSRRAPRQDGSSVVGGSAAAEFAPKCHPVPPPVPTQPPSPRLDNNSRPSRPATPTRAPRHPAAPAAPDPRSRIDTPLTSAGGGESERSGSSERGGAVAVLLRQPQSATFTASTCRPSSAASRISALRCAVTSTRRWCDPGAIRSWTLFVPGRRVTPRA